MKRNEIIEDYLKKGSDASSEKVVQTYTPLVFSACLRKTANEEVSKDVTQQVFLDFHKKAHTLINHPNIAGWFYQAALFAAAKYLRKQIREQKRMEKLQEIHDLNEETRTVWLNKIKPELDDAIQQIPEKLRLAIIQHYLVGDSVIEASEELNISQAAMHKRLARGRELIKDILSRKHAGITSVIVLSILSSSELRAAPQRLISQITASLSESLSLPMNLTGKILFMSTSKKIMIAAITLLLSGAFILGVLAQKEDQKNNSHKNKLAVNKKDAETAPSTTAFTSDDKKRIKLGREIQIKENKLTGEELLTHITSIFKEDKSEWYRILKEGGVNIDKAFLNEIIDRSFGANSVTHRNAKMFLFTLFKEWGKLNPKNSVAWLVKRNLHNTEVSRFIFGGIHEESPEEAKELWNLLPESKEKEGIASLIVPLPFDQLVNNFNKAKAQMGELNFTAMQNLSSSMVRSDPSKAMIWAKENLDPESYSSFIRGAAKVLAEKSPSLALESLNDINDLSTKSEAIKDMIVGSIEKTPEVARELLKELPDYEVFYALNDALGYLIFMKNEQEKAIKWTESLDEEYKGLVAETLAIQLSKRDLNKAVHYAEANISDNYVDVTLSKIAAEAANYNLEQSAHLVQSLLKKNDIELYHQEVETRKTYKFSNEEKINRNLYSSVNRITKNMIMREPDEAVQWLKEIPFKNQADYKNILLDSLSFWHNRFPEDASSWVQNSNLDQTTVDDFFKKVEDRPKK